MRTQMSAVTFILASAEFCSVGHIKQFDYESNWAKKYPGIAVLTTSME